MQHFSVERKKNRQYVMVCKIAVIMAEKKVYVDGVLQRQKELLKKILLVVDLQINMKKINVIGRKK